MRRHSLIRALVRLSLVPTLSALAVCSVVESRSSAQNAPAATEFRTRESKLKTEKEISDKAKAKSKAEVANFPAFEEYYRDYLLPQLTHSAEAINGARREIVGDLAALETGRDKELIVKFNAMLVKELADLLSLPDKDGRAPAKSYSPITRINAAVLVGRMNSSAANNIGVPEAKVQPLLVGMMSQSENDGLVSSAYSTLSRHLRANVVSDAYKKGFVAKLRVHLDSPQPAPRNLDAQNYLTEQVIDCLTQIAKVEPEKEHAKLATAALLPTLVKIITTEGPPMESEWLVESAMLSLGEINTTGLAPEDVLKVEKSTANFVKRSIKDWKKRIFHTNAMGGGGMGSGGMMGGMGGSEGGYGGMKGGMGGEGEGGGMFGGSGAGGNKKPPKKEEPKELKNARRIAQQRFEKIHMALNGAPRKPLASATKVEKERGLLAIVPETEKEKVKALIEKVEQFQTDVSDEKVADLNSLTVKVYKSIKEMREACELIVAEAKVKTETDEDPSSIFGSGGK